MADRRQVTAEERARWRELSGGTHIPMCSFRWMRDYDGERILQQRCETLDGEQFWKDVPEAEYDER